MARGYFPPLPESSINTTSGHRKKAKNAITAKFLTSPAIRENCDPLSGGGLVSRRAVTANML